MDLNRLQAFIEVAYTESFSAAGARLFITQPAVSKRISALEDEQRRRESGAHPAEWLKGDSPEWH